jgi:hypothetical protein
MFHPSQTMLVAARQAEIRAEIESVRISRLARRPRRTSVRRSLGRRIIRIGARLAADPSLRPARTI